MARISFKCLPYGDLPYTDDKLTTKMMVKLFENVPYLAMLPHADEHENLCYRTLENIPGVIVKGKKTVFKKDTNEFKQGLRELDSVFNHPYVENLEKYKINSFFFPKYIQILKRIKPAETVVNLLGPFTIAQLLTNKDDQHILADKCYRKLVIQAVSVKAMWIINKIKEASPDTVPIIILEEPLFSHYGDIKRENEDVTRETVINLFTKVINKIKEYHGLVGIQCFEKCDWQIPLEAGADIISFDAYNNPNNLNIIAEKINNFLIGGGRINWAIVPVKTEALVKSLNIDSVYNRFIKTIDGLIVSGVSERLAYNRSTVSIQGNVDKLPIIFAEKALILSTQLAKRIPFKS